MAKNIIKGLTVEIGGDTTKLGKALENVNKKSRDLSSELGDVNRLLKFDPANTDLLSQKQKILASAVENTKDKLDTLKKAEEQVQEQFKRGEVSEAQVRALQREIVATTNKMEGYERAARETADALKEVGDGAKKAAEESAEANAKMADFAGNGLKVVAGVAAAAVTALTAAAESTREYRTEMGKLNTAFTDNGFSSSAATGAYKELVGVLGETEQAVETANHLAKLTDNEKDLATWTGDILPGVFATFGASLPIEGLTEAANETAKVGQVTGPLADALNWAGVSEDAFNESLAKCTTEQERQALITETLNGLYGEASAKYKETNADVIAANQATDAWNASLAEVGAEVEPLLTSVKQMGAELLEKFVPVLQWIIDNLPSIGIMMAGLTAATIAQKIATIAATAATQGMTLAQYAAATATKVLNAAMKANPIGLIITLVAALIAIIVSLVKNNDKLREKFVEAWKKIKSAVGSVLDWFKTVPGKIWNAIVGAVNRVKQWGSNLVSSAKSAAVKFVSGVFNTMAALPSKIWSAIVGAVSRVKQWGSSMISSARSSISNFVSQVVSALKSLPGKVVSIGRDLVSGLWNGVREKLQWLKNKISGFASSVLGKFKSLFGVHSPSTETAWIGEMLDQGLAEGLLDNQADPEAAMRKVSQGVLSAAQDANGLSLERGISHAAATPAGASTVLNGGLMSKLDSILEAIERGQVLTIDKDKLVGYTLNSYDSKLGQRSVLAKRGAL
jgi:phage-related protein